MKSISILVPLILAYSVICTGQTAPPMRMSVAVRMSVDEAVAQALAANPEIRAAVRRQSLAQLKAGTARSLDDPMLMVRDWNTPLRQPWDLNQSQLMFMLQQTFLSRQKRDAHALLAGDDAEIAASDLESLRQEVAVEVRKACSDLMRNADEMKLHEREASLMKEALNDALAQYTVGKVSQADVLRAQMALTRLSEHLIELDEEREKAQAQLNTLRGSSPDEAIEIVGEYASPTALPSIEELELLAIEHRPELAGVRKQIARSKDQAQLTRLAMKPDFTIGLGYMLMPTGSYSRNAYMAELTMNLPWLNRARHEGEAKQADAATDLTTSELEARTTTVFLEIREAQIEVESAQKRLKLYRDTLMPQAEATFKASTAAYQNNRAEFMTLIESQNLLLDIESANYKTLSTLDVSIAQLERAIGTELPGKDASLPGKERTSK